jgi:hypothetical protein
MPKYEASSFHEVLGVVLPLSKVLRGYSKCISRRTFLPIFPNSSQAEYCIVLTNWQSDRALSPDAQHVRPLQIRSVKSLSYSSKLTC